MNKNDWVAVNRAEQKWSRREQIGRVLWAFSWPLFRLSPRPLWGWRRILLRLFGAKIGPGVHIYPTVQIAIPWKLRLGAYCAIGDRAILYSLGLITVEDRSTVSQRAHLCAGTHDISDPTRPLLKLPIVIGADSWICADAFIGPGVVIGKRVIIGARSVIMKDVEEDMVMVGNPARQIKRVSE